jgi:hypothetical protein
MLHAMSGFAVALVACSAPAAAPKPTNAPKTAPPPKAPAAASPVASPSPAAVSPVANGEVDKVDGRNVTIVTNLGPRRVEIPTSATVLIEGDGTTGDLKNGVLVGITGRPDGTALVVRIFPPGVSPKPDQFPMGGAQAGNIMTNARIDAFDGSTLTVDLGGSKQPIKWVNGTSKVVKPLPSKFEDIQPGKRILAAGTPSADGGLVAQTVTIITQPAVQRA